MHSTIMDTFQEMDQVSMMRPVVKGAYRVDIAARIPEYVSIAFREAMDGKKGPVYLDLPGDILLTKLDAERLFWPDSYRVESRPAGDPASLRRAIDLLREAERPLLVTGSGVLWAGASDE